MGLLPFANSHTLSHSHGHGHTHGQGTSHAAIHSHPLQNGQPSISISVSNDSPIPLTSMDDLVSDPGLADGVSKTPLKYYNRALISYLSQQGLNMNPLKLSPLQFKDKSSSSTSTFFSPLRSNRDTEFPLPIHASSSNSANVETFITGNGQILFLPFTSTKKKRRNANIRDEYNDDNEDNDHDDHDMDNDNDNENNDGSGTTLDLEGITDLDNIEDLTPEMLHSILNHGASKSSTPSSNHQNLNMAYHNFAIIFKVNKPVTLNTIVKVSYHTHASVKWIAPEHSKKESFDERYRTSETVNWNLDMLNPDCYIPFKEPKEEAANDLNDTDFDDPSINDSLHSDSFSLGSLQHMKKVLDVKYSDKPTQNIKIFKPLNPRKYVMESPQLNKDSTVEANLFNEQSPNSQSENLSRGYYIFLLPVLYPSTTTESSDAPDGRLSHDFNIQIQKGNVTPPTLQAPQTAFLSTSPSHHYKYDDQNFEFSQANNPSLFSEASTINSNASFTNNNSLNAGNGKSSFFRKIGIRRNSASSTGSTPANKLSISPRPSGNIMNNVGTDSRSRSSSINNVLGHSLHPNFHLNNNLIFNYHYNLPAVRLPPSDATSTLNKSIYVNKVWNNALNYELLLPKKFTQLSPPRDLATPPNDKFLKKNSFLLQMKLVPLVKNLQLKRIKINITEKITYSPKNSNNTSDEQRKNNRAISRERVVSMMEIKTKEKVSHAPVGPTTPQKSHIIKNCVNDNLLTFCYNNEASTTFAGNSNSTSALKASSQKIHKRSDSFSSSNSRSRSNSVGFMGKKMSRFLDSSFSHNNMNHAPSTSIPVSSNLNNEDSDEDVVITNPVKLQCPLTFVANDDSKFISNVYENLCKGTSDFTGLRDDENDRDKNADTMSIFSVNSTDKADAASEYDDLGLSKSPIRQNTIPRGRTFSFSNGNTGTNLTTASSALASNGSLHNIHHTNPNWDSVKNDENYDHHSFLPDVTSNHLKIRHRLQISFRISRPDSKLKNGDQPKMHHYEVIVDTPIVFVSSFCVSEALNLPSYEDAVRIGAFEVLKGSHQFAMSSMSGFDSENNLNLLSYESHSSGEDNNTTFAPCSPLMSDNLNTIMNANGVGTGTGTGTGLGNGYYNASNGIPIINNTAQVTNTLSMTPSTYSQTDFPGSYGMERSNSGAAPSSIVSASPMNNATSLLSAAFSKSKDKAGIHGMLSADFSSLSLNERNANSHVNNIDALIADKPPTYTEIGFKPQSQIAREDGDNTSSNLTPGAALNGKPLPPPPSYEKAVGEDEDDISVSSIKVSDDEVIPADENVSPEQNVGKKSVYASSEVSSTLSFKPERLALLNKSEVSDIQNSHNNTLTAGVNTSNGGLRLVKDRNMSIESDMSNVHSLSFVKGFGTGNGGDLDSISNMTIGDAVSLNMTPTRHDD